MRDAMTALAKAQPHLTRQEYKVIRGQIKAGDAEGAKKGIRRLLRRKGVLES